MKRGTLLIGRKYRFIGTQTLQAGGLRFTAPARKRFSLQVTTRFPYPRTPAQSVVPTGINPRTVKVQELPPGAQHILAALELVLASPAFQRSAKQSAFLRFVVERNCEGTVPSSFEIATDCFDRPAIDDPNDAYVRNIASQTRKSLKNYYNALHTQPDIVIQLAEKGYKITCPSSTSTSLATPSPILAPATANLAPSHKLLPTIAVIPFHCSAGSSEHGVLGHILSDTLITNLAKSKYMRVISRRTSIQFDDSKHTTHELGKMLNADYIVEGRFYVHGDTLRVQAELCSCNSNEVIWAEQMRSTVEAVVAETDELVDQLLYGVTSQLLNHELQRALSAPLASLQCHSLMIASINIMHRGTSNDINRAKDMLELLTQRNPLHAAPYAHLAYLGVLDNVRDADHGETYLSRQFVQENTKRALDIDSQHPIALTANGAIKSHFEGDFIAARSFYEQAIKYAPNEAPTMGRLSVAQLYTESPSKALKTVMRAIAVSPFDPELYFFHSAAAAAAFGEKKYKQAIENAEKSSDLFPTHSSNLRTLIGAYTALNDHESATRYKSQLLKIDPLFNLERYRSQSPFPHNEIIQRLTKFLEKSGLPLNSNAS